MRKLSTILLVGFLLALLCFAVQSPPVSAHTNTVASRADEPIAVTTYLQRGEDGYYFSLTRVSLTADSQLVIVNETGLDVVLTNNGNPAGVLLRGDSYVTAFYAGVYHLTDAQENIRVPLTIVVQGGYWQGGNYGRGYPGRRY